MLSQKIKLSDLYDSNRWNAEYFITKKNTRNTKSTKYPEVILSDLLSERKEFLNPQEYQNKTLNYIGLENISQNTRELTGFKPKLCSEIKSRCKIYRDGDILYGRLRPTLNKCLLIDKHLHEGICSTEIFVLTPVLANVVPEFLAELLVSPIVLDQVWAITAGAALPRMQISEFLELKVPLPTKAIQKELAKTIRLKREEIRKHCIKATFISEQLPKIFVDSIITGKKLALKDKPIKTVKTYNNPLPKGDFCVKKRKRS